MYCNSATPSNIAGRGATFNKNHYYKFGSSNRLPILMFFLLLFCHLVLLTPTEVTTASTIDAEALLSSYGKGLVLNDTTLHGGEEHNRFGAGSGVGAGGWRLTDEQVLLRQLLGSYERSARPVKHKSSRVTVELGLTVTQIFELDERNEVLITNVWLDQQWYDEYLTWNVSNFTNLEMMRIPSSKIWLPDIVLYNNAADYSTRIVETRAMVAHDGFVFWPLPVKLFSSCKVNVKYFPFDEQVCHMKFGSWTYDGFKLDLTNRTEGADLSMYIENGEWDLISVLQRRNVVTYTCCEEPYPDVTFYIYIKRKTLYYLHNVFFPCFVMSTLTLLVFLLPPDSGEKCALGITVMLAFAVFMLTVIEKLPETSESVPLISIYLTVVMSMTAISVILTVIVLNLHHKTARSWRLASWVLRVLDRLAPFCCLNKVEEANNNGDNGRLAGVSVDKLPPVRPKSPSQRSHLSVKFAPDNNDTPMVKLKTMNASCYSNCSNNNSHFMKDGASVRPAASSHQILRMNSTDFLQELESEMDALGSGYFSAVPRFTALPPDHALALAVIRMMERHRNETKIEDIIRDWRRLAQLVDRCLFWLFFTVVVSFTIFILIFAPNEKLL